MWTASQVLTEAGVQGEDDVTAAYELAVKACTRAGNGSAALQVYSMLEHRFGDMEPGASRDGGASMANTPPKFSAERILLDTADAAITGAIAGSRVGSSASPCPPGEMPSDDLGETVHLMEVMAKAGIRPKIGAVDGAISQLLSKEHSRSPTQISHPHSDILLPGPSRAKDVEKAKRDWGQVRRQSKRNKQESRAPPSTPDRVDSTLSNEGLDRDLTLQRLERAVALVNAMPRLVGVAPNASMYLRLMVACVGSDQHDKALAIWNRMGEESLQRCVKCWTLYVKVLAAKGDLAGRAKQVVKDMRAEGAIPDKVFYATLRKNCSRSGDAEGARYVHGLQRKEYLHVSEEEKKNWRPAQNLWDGNVVK